MGRSSNKGKARKNTKKSSANAQSQGHVNPDIAGIIYMASGFVLGIAIYTDFAGALSVIAQKLSYGLIGIGSYVLPLYLIYFGFEYIKTRGNISLKTKKFIGIGTVAEYSFCESIMDVNAKQTPNDMYGAAKTAVHYLLETRARILKMPFIWTVIPSTFGEGRRDNNIITYTIMSLLRGEKPEYGYLTQMWDFLYVKEVVRALRYIG